MTASRNDDAGTDWRAPVLAGAQGYIAGTRNANPRATLHQAERYSAFVRFMKRVLPLGALAVGLAVLLYAVQPRDNGQVAMTFESMGSIEDDLAMINPRLTGTDDNGLPFIVTAAAAVQLGASTERVRLRDVKADLTMEDGTLLTVTAADGIVDNSTQTLDVSGGIRMTTADGYSAETERATADLRQGLVRGDAPVTAEGAMGTLTADGFTFEREIGMLTFIGNVRMQVHEATP
jgi:lipopolysaccharide export system protein LptC